MSNLCKRSLLDQQNRLSVSKMFCAHATAIRPRIDSSICLFFKNQFIFLDLSRALFSELRLAVAASKAARPRACLVTAIASSQRDTESVSQLRFCGEPDSYYSISFWRFRRLSTGATDGDSSAF